jgi:hypothetical protein
LLHIAYTGLYGFSTKFALLLHAFPYTLKSRSNMAAVQDVLSPLPDITPEKLTILKLKHSTLNRDVFSEPSSPIGELKGMNFSNQSNNMSSVITRRSSSRAANGARRRSSFLNSHRSEMSRELTSQVSLLQSHGHNVPDIISPGRRQVLCIDGSHVYSFERGIIFEGVMGAYCI